MITYTIITPVGDNGITEYWEVSNREGKTIVYTDPFDEKEPPCQECGYEIPRYTLDLGLEIEGATDGDK